MLKKQMLEGVGSKDKRVKIWKLLQSGLGD
jgi:hypothetical protein